MYTYVVQSLVGQCEYATGPKGSFQCRVIDTMGVVLLSKFINKFVLVFYLSFLFRYLVELRLLQNLKNEATWTQTWVILQLNNISRLMKYGKLRCIEFYSCYLQQRLSIDLFFYSFICHDQNGPVNKVCPSFRPKVFLELALYFFLELSMVLGAHVMLCMTELDYFEFIGKFSD